MPKELGPGLRIMIVLTILAGVALPCRDDRRFQLVFPRAGERQLGDRERKIVGSSLIGQNFTKARVTFIPAFFGGQRVRRHSQRRLQSGDPRKR